MDINAIQARAEAATIPGYDGYEADNEGNIWSVASNWRGYGRRKLAPTPDPDGYLKVRLYRNGKRVRKAVHHLVALAFYGTPKNGQEVRHLNGDKTDNVVTNLAWGSRKENADDREIHGHTPRGSNNGLAKLSEEQVIQVKALLVNGEPQREIAQYFGVSQRTICRINRGEGWRHVTG